MVAGCQAVRYSTTQIRNRIPKRENPPQHPRTARTGRREPRKLIRSATLPSSEWPKCSRSGAWAGLGCRFSFQAPCLQFHGKMKVSMVWMPNSILVFRSFLVFASTWLYYVLLILIASCTVEGTDNKYAESQTLKHQPPCPRPLNTKS